MKQQAAHSHEDKLLDFAYGELPEAEARSVETHLAGCTRCAGSLESIRGVRRTMSLLETEPAPDAGMDSLLAYAQQTARRIQAGPASAPSRWRAWVFGLAGAASLVVVGIVGTTVSKEFSPQAVIQQKAQVSTAAPAEAPEPVQAEPASEGIAAGAAGNALAERATRVTPTVPPQRGRVVSDKDGQFGDGREAELDVGRLGERAKRDVSRRGSLDSLNDDQDMTQGGRNLGGLGTGMTTGGGYSESPKEAPSKTEEKRSQPEIVSNYQDSRTAMSPPPPPAMPRTYSSPPKDAEQKATASRMSIGKGAKAPAGAAMDEDRYESSAYRNKEEAQEEKESLEDPAQAGPAAQVAQAPVESAPVAVDAPLPRQSMPPQAPATTRSAASDEKPSAKKKLSSLSATDYERLADRSRAEGELKMEIRYLWEAVGQTSPGGQQIGLLSRLCELEVSAEMYQPQSCHRLLTDYPRHNAGLLAKKRLEAQQQQMQRK